MRTATVKDDARTDPDDHASPWTQRGFILSAVVVGLLLVLGAVLVFTGPDDGDDPTTAQPDPARSSSTPTAPSASPTASPVTDSTCGLPAGDTAVPTSAPPATQWELVGTVAAPTAPDTHGPGVVTDGLRSCFAHTPTGALYAAVNVVGASGVPKLREPLITNLAAAGSARDQALQRLTSEGAGTSTGGGVQVAGFTFLNYDATSTTVDLAVQAGGSGQSSLVHIPVALRWESGDWKVVLADDGSLGAGIGPIPDLTGYAPWAGA